MTIDLEPIARPSDRDPEVPGKRGIAPPGPAEVLTGGIAAELRARALHGGEPGGYGVRCTLDRFAIRTDTVKRFLIEVVYVDLACDVRRKADRALVWRGELRGRAGAIEAERMFATDDAAYQALADRLMSDASREIASDLAIGVLGLEASPSKRVFANDGAERESAGIDDGALGSLILAEDEDATRAVVPQLREGDPLTRAAAWNAVAMAARPDGSWIAGIETSYDDDAFVRLFQYKAFARHASPSALSDLRRALKREDQTFLEEFLRDAIAAGTLGVKHGGPPRDAQGGTPARDETP